MNVIDLCERGYIPDSLARFGMRRLIAQRLADESAGDVPVRHKALVSELRQSPVAVHTDAANEQHYEVPADFFRLHLGPRLKYSCALFEGGELELGPAEDAMLEMCALRAHVEDGQRILDLGCGWGSLSLWLAEKFPNAQVTGLSNSHGQRKFIEKRAAERGLKNLTIYTGNVVEFEFPPDVQPFDRVMSIEMFEHMRNYQALLAKVAGWLKPGGFLFAHVFAHKTLAYSFEVKDGSDWMSQYFFTGGLMPSAGLLAEFQDDLRHVERWWVDGAHYERTANLWLGGMDINENSIMTVFREAYGKDAPLWFQRWRMFYMAVAELFGYEDGAQWGVSHHLFQKPEAGAAR
jgi:cyclopropane-fatty-acyl-phospholipid synthase